MAPLKDQLGQHREHTLQQNPNQELIDKEEEAE